MPTETTYTPSELLQYLPAIYSEEPFLGQFLLAFEKILLGRDDSPAGVPSAVVAAAFRTAKGGVGQTPVSGGSEVIVFRVTDIIDPAADTASDAVKKLKDSLDRALTEEQIASYVNKLETDIGTTINQAAFAQVTGANQ